MYERSISASQWIGGTILALGISAILIVLIAHLNLWTLQATEETRLRDPSRVQQIYTSFTDRQEQLKSLRLQIGTTEQSMDALQTQYNGLEASKWDYADRYALKSLQQSYTDLITAYNNQCSQYNADWENQYKADYVGIAPDRCEYVSASGQ
jgi:hypothetical protein